MKPQTNINTSNSAILSSANPAAYNSSDSSALNTSDSSVLNTSNSAAYNSSKSRKSAWGKPSFGMLALLTFSLIWIATILKDMIALG